MGRLSTNGKELPSAGTSLTCFRNSAISLLFGVFLACWFSSLPILVSLSDCATDAEFCAYNPGMTINSSRPIQVAVLEDNPAMLEQLTDSIAQSDELQLVWSGMSLQEGTANIERPSDVLICDLQLSDGMSFDLINTFAMKGATKVVVFSVFGDEASTVRAIEAGASGYLLKGEGAPDLQKNIQAIMRGESPISPAIAAHLLQRMQNSSDTSDTDVNHEGTSHEMANHEVTNDEVTNDEVTTRESTTHELTTHQALTKREIEVLSLLARGLRYKEVANELGCSYHTVAQHVKNIYAKLSVNSKSAAVFTASNAGIISLED